VTKAEFSKFVAEISAAYPESVREFFQRFAAEQEDVIEWEELFATLVDRYAKLAALQRGVSVSTVSRSGDVTPASTSTSVGTDSAALPTSEVMATASRVLKELLPQAPEVLNVQSLSQHSDFASYSEDFGAAASVKLVMSEILGYCDALKILVDKLPYLDRTALALDEFSGLVEGVVDDDLLDPEYETDPALSTHGRRTAERACIEDIRESAHAFHEAFDDVDDAFDEDLEVAPSEYGVRVSADIKRAFGNVRSLIDTIFEC
jgi:hypothetical protein